MPNNFIHMRLRNEQFFNPSPNPQQNHVVVYVKKKQDKYVLMAEDENGKHIQLTQSNNLEDIQRQLDEILDYIESSSSCSSCSSF